MIKIKALLYEAGLSKLTKLLIEQKIKELYGTKASFCDTHGYKYKDFASKLRTFENRVNWINEFIEPLGLEIQIAPKRKSGEEEK